MFCAHTLRRLLLLPLFLSSAGLVIAQDPASAPQFQERLRNIKRLETQGMAEPFKGVTSDGDVVRGLFSVVSTGVSTDAVRGAAEAFIATLDEGERGEMLFPVNDDEWRLWANQSIYDSYRQGMSLEMMNEEQREAALGLLRASLSAKGLRLAEDIMHLNYTLGELQGGNFFEYGDQKYWLTLMGEPHPTEPWGWQIDGHHLNLNYFVMGDQVVMTPAFWGSEPTIAESGKYAGTQVLQEEQEAGRRLVLALDESQRSRAVLSKEKPGNNILTEAFSDNVQIPYAGIRASDLTEDQREQLVNLIGLYVGNMREGHARVRMDEVVQHLDDTWFAWVGGSDKDSVYYYRIQSPVILIEFDHEAPVGLTHLYPPGVPYREHIHSVVRTPNGNDYGKDLLRQHYEQHPH